MELIIVVIWLICGVAAGAVASGKHHNGCLWMLLGLLMGPIALLIAAAMPATAKAQPQGPIRKCPECAEWIKAEARKCRFCGAEVAPQTQ